MKVYLFIISIVMLISLFGFLLNQAEIAYFLKSKKIIKKRNKIKKSKKHKKRLR